MLGLKNRVGRMAGPPTRVRVRLVQDTETLEKSVEVEVHSRIKPDLHRVGRIPLEHGEQRTARHVGATAGSIAEDLCRDYGDTLDPSEIAGLAMEAFRECMAKANGK